VAILLVRQRPAHTALLGGTLALGLGLAITLIGMVLPSGAALFGGTVVAGLGFGAAFNGSVRSLVSLAQPEERGALMAGFFSLSYLAFSVPAVLAGLAVGVFGLAAAALGFGLALLALCGIAGGLMLRA
jgi:MFS family permease